MESQIKIEKNIPLPKNTALWEKYPFGEMEVGDSFYVENMNASRFSPLIQGYVRSLERPGAPLKKFSCKSNSEGGMRCWRVK